MEKYIETGKLYSMNTSYSLFLMDYFSEKKTSIFLTYGYIKS